MSNASCTCDYGECEVHARSAAIRNDQPPPPRPEDRPPQDDAVLGYCPHGVNLDRAFCPKGCRV